MNELRDDPMPWASFAASVAATARALPDNGTFALYREEVDRDDFGSSTPKYVQVCRYGGSMLRCEVVSNAYLPRLYAWTPEQEATLVSMGWNRPAPDDATASPNWYLDVALVWAEAGVDRIVRVLRDLWGAERLRDVVVDDLGRWQWVDTPTEDLADDPGR